MRVRLVRHEAALLARQKQAGARLQGRGRVVLVLDDVRSLWNVGSMFRSADCLGTAHLYLCGITGIPPHRDIHRTALGAEDSVPWSYHPHPFEALDALRAAGARIVALERTADAVALRSVAWEGPIGLVVGNEEGGVAPEVLAACDVSCDIEMRGTKNSLNVAVACGIALYQIDALV